MRRIGKNNLHLFLLFLICLFVSACSSMNACKTCPPCPVIATDNDAKITDQVQHALMKDNASVAHLLQVQTKNGIVLLSGFIKNKQQAMDAMSTAAKVPGVKSVKVYFVNHY